MPVQPYHKYVFDAHQRKFVGRFEEMYANEGKEHFDSWFQDDVSDFSRRFSSWFISQHRYASILDVGCGKGTFTNLLKKSGKRIVGVDISQTAIAKAKSRYPGIDFLTMTVNQALDEKGSWDLIVMMEILSYLKDWRKMIQMASRRSRHIFISLYLPPKPMGFVKSFSSLKKSLTKYFEIEMELLWKGEHIFLMGNNCLKGKGKL